MFLFYVYFLIGLETVLATGNLAGMTTLSIMCFFCSVLTLSFVCFFCILFSPICILLSALMRRIPVHVGDIHGSAFFPVICSKLMPELERSGSWVFVRHLRLRWRLWEPLCAGQKSAWHIVHPSFPNVFYPRCCNSCKKARSCSFVTPLGYKISSWTWYICCRDE